jgi:hypothetical protein
MRDLFGWKSMAMPNRYVQQAAAADAADLHSAAAVAALEQAAEQSSGEPAQSVKKRRNM